MKTSRLKLMIMGSVLCHPMAHSMAPNSATSLAPQASTPITIQGGNTLTAGPGVDCGFPNLLTAVNFAGPGDTIMVAATTYSGVDAKLTINKSLTIVGGLDDNCQVFTAERTRLQLDDFGPVLDIDVSGGRTVHLSGLEITGAQHDNLADYDGGIHAVGDGTLNIDNSWIHGNQSHFGGGIAVRSGVQLNLSNQTVIDNNTAVSQGGGVYCSAANINAIDTLIGQAEAGNELTAENSLGGGLAATFCDIHLGQSVLGDGPVTIEHNRSGEGGGLYVHSSNLSFGQVGSRISHNQLTNPSGSGNSLLGSGDSLIELTDLAITDNIFGSIITMQDNTSLIMDSSCDQATCLHIMRNSGSHVFRFTGGSNGIINRALVADNLHGNLLTIVGQEAVNVTLQNTLFVNNLISGTDGYLMFTNTHGSVFLNQVTLAQNSSEVGMLYALANGSFDFSGSIIWDNEAPTLAYTNNQGLINVSDSVIQYPTQGMTNTLQLDPLFTNPVAGNFSLRGTSPAVDHFVGILSHDIDNDPRPMGAMHDAGADEFKDLIFANSFELK